MKLNEKAKNKIILLQIIWRRFFGKFCQTKHHKTQK